MTDATDLSGALMARIFEIVAAPNVVPMSKAAYLTSNLAKARSRIALVCRLARRLDAQAEDVGIALTRGTGALPFAELTAETIRDLRIAAADLEALVRLHEAETAPEPPQAA